MPELSLVLSGEWLFAISSREEETFQAEEGGAKSKGINREAWPVQRAVLGLLWLTNRFQE